jgi:hypothetical protein
VAEVGKVPYHHMSDGAANAQKASFVYKTNEYVETNQYELFHVNVLSHVVNAKCLFSGDTCGAVPVSCCVVDVQPMFPNRVKRISSCAST